MYQEKPQNYNTKVKELREFISKCKGQLPDSKWVCHQCGRIFPNTKLFCPIDDIARKHNQNLWINRPEEGVIK